MNIHPAERVNQVSEYYFSQKLREIALRNSNGENIISLGIGSPDLPPHASVTEALTSSANVNSNHGYQSYVGIPELRQAMAAWYERCYGVTVNASTEVLPLMGSKEGILHLSMALLNPGDGVLIPNPGYPTYGAVSRLIGANVITYDLKEENNWMPDFELLDKMDLTRVRLMWVNYPHMPTGTPATQELFKQLVAFGKRHNIVICNDNPYSFILNDNPLSIFNVEGAREVCVEFNSLSKSHNMPGWRIGMMIARPELIEWTLRFKSNIDSGMYKPLQLAAAQALSLPMSWHYEMNQLYSKRRHLAEEILRTMGCHFNPTQQGLFLWGRIPKNATDDHSLTEKILNEAHVFVVPGSVFGSNGNRHIRLSLCANETTLQEALYRVKKIFPTK